MEIVNKLILIPFSMKAFFPWQVQFSHRYFSRNFGNNFLVFYRSLIYILKKSPKLFILDTELFSPKLYS